MFRFSDSWYSQCYPNPSPTPSIRPSPSPSPVAASPKQPSPTPTTVQVTIITISTATITNATVGLNATQSATRSLTTTSLIITDTPDTTVTLIAEVVPHNSNDYPFAIAFISSLVAVIVGICVGVLFLWRRFVLKRKKRRSKHIGWNARISNVQIGNVVHPERNTNVTGLELANIENANKASSPKPKSAEFVSSEKESSANTSKQQTPVMEFSQPTSPIVTSQEAAISTSTLVAISPSPELAGEENSHSRSNSQRSNSVKRRNMVRSPSQRPYSDYDLDLNGVATPKRPHSRNRENNSDSDARTSRRTSISSNPPTWGFVDSAPLGFVPAPSHVSHYEIPGQNISPMLPFILPLTPIFVPSDVDVPPPPSAPPQTDLPPTPTIRKGSISPLMPAMIGLKSPSTTNLSPIPASPLTVDESDTGDQHPTIGP
ncbi:hypothetical protein HK098_004219 [Nowakowskiella sp. JEL0407]|nr:hypothetical protein HK098_004219 [Nowakowskiella sp. JEL0407]